MIPEVNNPSVQYKCDGNNRRWQWPYDFHRIEDIKLILVDADGNESEQSGNLNYDKQNKVVIYPAVGDALSNNYKVILERRTQLSQTADLPDRYPFENIEHMVDKVTLILQEMQEKLGRTLMIRVGSDENPTEVARKIVDDALKSANAAIDAYAKIKVDADKIHADANEIKTLGADVKTLSNTVDDKLATANKALDTSTSNVNRAEQMVSDAKAYAAKVEVDKKDINQLAVDIRSVKSDIDNKQSSALSNAKKAEDAAKRAETAANKAVEIALPNGAGVMTKSEAASIYMRQDSLGGVVSVKDFGAVGDGVTNDTAAFKKANDNLANKILYIPTGQYNINEHMSFNTVKSVIDNGIYTNIKPFYPSETPMLKGANNIALVKNITYDDEVNQCQGFTYNSKKNVFVLACVSGDGSNQILYELNPDTFEKVGTYKFKDADRMGHCNTMTYNKYTNKIYVANGLKNGNNLTVINADTMAIENTITLKERVFNIDYDPITRTYVSIVPISGNQRVREVNLYSDDFKKFKTYQIDYQYEDFNNNGAFMLNGAIMSATLGSLVECTPFGKVKQIIEINKSTEIEDIAYYNDKFYFAVLTEKHNKRHQVDIYVGDPNYDFENSINTQRLKNLDYLGLNGGTMKGAIIMPNNTSLQVKDTKGSAHHAVKMSTGNSMEFGMSDNRTLLLGNYIGYYDQTKDTTYRILTEADAKGNSGILTKDTADNEYLKKTGNQVMTNGNIVGGGLRTYSEGNINTWNDSNAYALTVRKALKNVDGTPQNGVVMQYGNSTNWRGCLFMSDNGNDGLYYGGFSNNNWQAWKRIYGEGQQNTIKFSNGSELWVE